MSRARIGGFDGVRGLSAIAVVLSHLHVYQWLEGHGLLSPAITPMLTGTTGVQAFFILSGYLITHLLIDEIDQTGTVSIKKFYIRRTLRIVPLHILFVALASLIYALDPRVTTKASLLYAAGYAYNFVLTGIYTPFLGHTWSLAVEEHFYLLWPFLFLGLFARRRRILIRMLPLAIFASPLIHALFIQMGLSQFYFVERWTFIAGYNIAVGCWLALILGSGEQSKSARASFGSRGAVVIGMVLLTIPAVLFGRSWIFDNVFSGYFRCAALACFIAWLVVRQESKAVTLLQWAPLRYIGTISYGVYMYQGLLLATGPPRITGHLWPPASVTGLILLVAIAPLSYHCFEAPIIRFKNRIGRGSSTTTVARR